MPQKKNPDAAELIRAKTGRVNGALLSLLTVMKGLPLAYAKDMQEDKESVFDVFDTLILVIKITQELIENMKIKKTNMYDAASNGFSTATDLADWFVRDLGIPFNGNPGKYNSITDVEGILVGHETIIEGDGNLIVGKGPIRTGITSILPRGMNYDPVFAGWYSLNGNGEMTGTTWVEESGFLEGPIMITNTHSVGVVRDAVIEWSYKNKFYKTLYNIKDLFWTLPVVAETYDGSLNDINGFHVKKEHAFNALNNARGGMISEGNVGGGTGMICHGFKAVSYTHLTLPTKRIV